MKKTAFILVIVVLLVLLVTFYLGGTPLVAEGLTRAGETAMRASLLIVTAFIVIGQLQVLISSEMIKKWLDKYSGNKSLVFSSLAGGLFPGGPYIFYPFLAGFKGKDIPFYIIFSFVIGKQNYDFTRLPLEISLATPGIAALRNIITLPFPFIMSLIVRRFFPKGFGEKSREQGEQ